MQSKVRSLVTCAGIGLFAMVSVTYAMRSSERLGSDEHRVIAEGVESPIVRSDDVTGAACGRCGDNFCNPRSGETPTTWPKVCGSDPMDADGTVERIQFMCGKCGDNFCNPSCGETPTSCPRDCSQTSLAEDC
jgi:hypothetical protein